MRTDLGLVSISIAVLVATAGPPVAHACGPDFPESLLSDRGAALFDLADGEFLAEVSALVPVPAAPYTVVIGDDPDGVRERGTAAEAALYDRGARAFAAGDLAAARAAFTELLRLPRELRLIRSTWAAYMLARLAEDTPAAIDDYRRVRALVDAGFLDERGLAASSLGQEARLRSDAGDVVGAANLYAAQAAHGHPDGPTSLLFVVRAAIADGADAALARDPVGQRLLATYVMTRRDELADDVRDRIWRELLAAEPVAGADRLAAAAYREARWDLAGQLAAREPTAIRSRWVLAKLALRAGDRTRADQLLAGVSAEIDACTGGDDGDAARIRGERAAVALADDRPADAMELAWQARATYPEDALYIAERVLTVDELRAFVDGLELDPIATATADAALADVPYYEAWTATRDRLRTLLARRLMRAGRHAEAEPYFPSNLLGVAKAFAAALERGRTAPDAIQRARGLFDASLLARTSGLDLLGTEVGPDWAFYDAAFDLSDADADGAAAAQRSAGERDRVAASAPADPHRYHYRYLASELAEAAADLLPHQSQAYAATLCHATRYIFNDDRDRVDRLYRRYIRTGPYVDFASSFGQSCPPPAFDRARRYLPPPRWRMPTVVAVMLLAGAIVVLGARVWLAPAR